MKNGDLSPHNREELIDLLRGGFAPVMPLLREFHHDKTAIVLDGLPFSAWSLLEHMGDRQALILRFMRNPEEVTDLWPAPYWPDKPDPGSVAVWARALDNFEKDLEEIIDIVENPVTPLFFKHSNGSSMFGAAVAVLQHNGYHAGQLKTIGRQVGIW